MFIDALLLLADAQAFTATAVSTNTIDLGDVTPKRDIGTGEPMELVAAVDVAGDRTTGDETYLLEFLQSANANLSSPDVLVDSAFTLAELVVGEIKRLPIPPGSITKRYIGARLTLAGTTPTITVTLFVQPSAMASLKKPQSYADAITVS